MKLNITWKNDCQGKKNYDGKLVTITTHYWPGPYAVFDLGLHEIYGARPSAKSTIWLVDCFGEELATKDFEGESFDDVDEQVKSWGQQQMDRIATALRAEFGKV